MAKKAKIVLTLNEEQRELVSKALEGHIGTFVKMHTQCMREKAMEAADELHKKISVMEKLARVVAGVEDQEEEAGL